jgi:hypothetical protein
MDSTDLMRWHTAEWTEGHDDLVVHVYPDNMPEHQINSNGACWCQPDSEVITRARDGAQARKHYHKDRLI